MRKAVNVVREVVSKNNEVPKTFSNVVPKKKKTKNIVRLDRFWKNFRFRVDKGTKQ